MLSTKTQALSGQLMNPFLGNQSPYVAISNPFNQYKNNIQSNVQLLKRRFPHEDPNKIKDLLEELDGNIQMVTEILTEQQDKNQMVCEKPAPKKMEAEDQNKMLKNAIARLYKKLIQQQKQLETIKGAHEKTKRENEDLKLQNCLLLQGEFSQNSFEEQRDIF